MLLYIIFFRFFVTSFDHHTPFNALIIFRAGVTLWHIFLVFLPSLVNIDPGYLNQITIYSVYNVMKC